MKKILLFISIGLLFAGSITPVFGQTTPTATPVLTPTPAIDRRLEARRQGALREADRRIARLNVLISRVATFNELSPEQKSSVTNSINAEIALLNEAKTRIQNATTIEAINQELQNMRNANGINSSFNSLIITLRSANRILTEVARLDASASRLTPIINTVKEWGINTADIDTAFASMQTHTNNAETLANQAINRVLAATAENRRNEIVEARRILTDAQREIRLARIDRHNLLRILIREISNFVKLEATPTPIPPTPIPPTPVP